MTVSREEFNGLGKRLSEVELLKPKVERNEKDIDTIFREFDEKTTKFSEKADKIFTGVVIGSVVVVIGLIIKEFMIK